MNERGEAMRILNLFWDEFENSIEIEENLNVLEDETDFLSSLEEAENDEDLLAEETLKELIAEKDKINDVIGDLGEIIKEKLEELQEIEFLIRRKRYLGRKGKSD